MKNLYFLVLLMLMILIVHACGVNNNERNNTSMSTRQVLKGGQASVEDDLSARNIVQIAAASEDHSTLVSAVQTAGLADVLANPGPLTVFAPNNAAFDKLPAGTVEELLKSENKKKLARIITYHAAAGTYKIKDLKDGMDLSQATGDRVRIEIKDEVVYVNGARILSSLEASNGMVHVVDKVLLPPDK